MQLLTNFFPTNKQTNPPRSFDTVYTYAKRPKKNKKKKPTKPSAKDDDAVVHGFWIGRACRTADDEKNMKDRRRESRGSEMQNDSCISGHNAPRKIYDRLSEKCIGMHQRDAHPSIDRESIDPSIRHCRNGLINRPFVGIFLRIHIYTHVYAYASCKASVGFFADAEIVCIRTQRRKRCPKKWYHIHTQLCHPKAYGNPLLKF